MVAEASAGGERTAVLFSGGLDSAVLVAHEAQSATVQPIYVSIGLAWEAGEREMVTRLLASAPFSGRVLPLASLVFEMTDIYAPTHWAVRGTPPAYDTPDEDVYLTGRNVVLLAKGGVYCAQHAITRLVLGPLAGNPFPDATPQFFDAMAAALSLGLAHPVAIAAPFGRLHKAEVIARGADLGVPFALTLSCMNPTGLRHCGVCSKCRERRDAFDEAGVADPTEYAAPSPRKRGQG